MSKNQKRFCCDCKYYIDEGHDDYCFEPSNTIDTYKRASGKPIKSPAELNKNNDCPMYYYKHAYGE